MKIHYKEIEISKGEETSKLPVVVELMKGLDLLFEKVEDKDAHDYDKMMGNDKKSVSKGDYVFKLTVEKVKEKTKCPECLNSVDQDELDTFGGLCETCYEEGM